MRNYILVSTTVIVRLQLNNKMVLKLIIITVEIRVGLEPSRHSCLSYEHMNEIYILFYFIIHIESVPNAMYHI